MINYCFSHLLDLQSIGTVGVSLSNFPWLSISILFPIISAFIVPFFPDKGDGKEVRWFALIVALITSISCQLGDLFFSFLKRKAKLKDTGKILPGHGGLLDRVDGLIFVMPLTYLKLFVI